METPREKTGGRQKGTPNKATANLRDTIQEIIERQFETLESDLEELEGKDRIAFVLKLIEYILPKQRETKIEEKTPVCDDLVIVRHPAHYKTRPKPEAQ